MYTYFPGMTRDTWANSGMSLVRVTTLLQHGFWNQGIGLGYPRARVRNVARGILGQAWARCILCPELGLGIFLGTG